MSEDYYTLQAEGSAWTKDSGEYTKRVFEAIDALGDIRGLHIADVGCGDGTSVQYLESKGAQVVGFEYSKEKVKYARVKKLNIHQFDLDTSAYGELIASDNDVAMAITTQIFDIVFCSHTLEHTRDCVQSTKNLCLMVKQGGRMLLIFPPEEERPVLNPSHTQWMTQARIDAVKKILEENFESVIEERKFRLEPECWFVCGGKK
jgi:2-polyprenyl-3-methyl-5-hydroxy-6-metoxy-1,4-benzoquinol methylase